MLIKFSKNENFYLIFFNMLYFACNKDNIVKKGEKR